MSPMSTMVTKVVVARPLLGLCWDLQEAVPVLVPVLPMVAADRADRVESSTVRRGSTIGGSRGYMGVAGGVARCRTWMASSPQLAEGQAEAPQSLPFLEQKVA